MENIKFQILLYYICDVMKDTHPIASRYFRLYFTDYYLIIILNIYIIFATLIGTLFIIKSVLISLFCQFHN